MNPQRPHWCAPWHVRRGVILDSGVEIVQRGGVEDPGERQAPVRLVAPERGAHDRAEQLRAIPHTGLKVAGGLQVIGHAIHVGVGFVQGEFS